RHPPSRGTSPGWMVSIGSGGGSGGNGSAIGAARGLADVFGRERLGPQAEAVDRTDEPVVDAAAGAVVVGADHETVGDEGAAGSAVAVRGRDELAIDGDGDGAFV